MLATGNGHVVIDLLDINAIKLLYKEIVLSLNDIILVRQNKERRCGGEWPAFPAAEPEQGSSVVCHTHHKASRYV